MSDIWFIKGLVERPSLNPKKGRRANWGSDEKTHQTEYIKRLTKLRDTLMDQEQTNLAHALDRLRMRQIIKDDANFRLRLNDSGTHMFSPRRRTMTTTFEKFQKMRPQKSVPSLVPLEGKQLIDPRYSDSPRMFLPETSESTPFPMASRVDDTVQVNLQRLSHPTSSIPNIGRKAFKRENLILHSHSCDKKSPRNPMLKHTHALSQGTLLTPMNKTKRKEVDLIPDTFKLEPLTEGDQLDMDKLRKYYYVYYLPSTTTSQDGGPPVTKPSKYPVKNRRVLSYKGSDKSAMSYDTSIFEDEGYATNGKVSLPCIESSATGTMHWNDNTTFSDDESEMTAHDPDYGTGRSSRVHLVVDMPDIIYNSATPDISEIPDIERAGTLTKTYKQNELRQRELNNLIEDVKELNIRTETLSNEFT